MKVLVTGGAGFIGSHIVDALVKDGHHPVVLDNLTTGKVENVNPRAAFFKADIRDKSIAHIFEKEKPEVVFHLAAQASVRISVDDPVADADINVLGSINLLQASVAHGVKKFIFSSSGGAVYGEQSVFPAPEGHPTAPESPYGIAKLTVERYLAFYRAVHGLPSVALRYSNVYGPRQDPHGEAGVVAIFIDRMLTGDTPLINGDGGQTRDFVYVADVVKANMAALVSSHTGIYNVGSGVETSVNQLHDILKEATGYQGGSEYGPAKAGEQRRSVVDCGLIGKVMGWAPSVPLVEGLGKTAAWFVARRKG